MYLLIRSKKNKCPENRLNDIFENPLYDRLKKEVPNFRKKVIPIIANFNVEDLELSENDKNMLMREVSIVFHLAATVRFEEEIKTSTAINVIATNVILDIAKHMPNLKSFIHVSTLYANCHVKHIEERFYTYPIDHKDLITFTRTLPGSVIDEKLTRIASSWPNTYTFTKAIAETLLRDEGRDLPIGIFRPAIVMPSANEPIVGWGDNLYGPVGSTLSVVLGFTRFQLCDPDIPANLVPVDLTVNALIASAWDVSNQCRWDYTDDNVQTMWDRLNEEDKQLFHFNIRELDWSKYLTDYYKGMRLYLLHEDDSTLEISRINYKRLYWTHQMLKTVLIFATLWIVWNIFAKIFV
ncbi:fatty acyl- reductase [Lasius niger]|uniref:Fatty acyl-CoA reductase n=1 Tax=Lasius niger TaxID=67767 RepID=A0A0J7KFC0_LASNI|nr:fatty acyl- reductase [Lasius niger]